MLDRNSATARIARQLKEAEVKVEEALLASSELFSTLIRARANADSPHVGQSALIRLVQAQRSILDGSSDLFRVHDVMSSIGREMGVLDEPNSTPPSGLLESDLTKTAA
jgi:hypothetical protein